MQWIKRLFIGRPLKSALLKHEKYNVFWGLSILSCDAISSIAYAPEEILKVLVPTMGPRAFDYLILVAAAIVMLLIIITIPYRQTIEQYPHGGGAYTVASDHLGTHAGVLAGVALLIDYILTVAVSIASGTSFITAVFPTLLPHQVIICVLLLIFLYIGNMRGVRESSRIFGIQAYVFMFAIGSMITAGLIKFYVFGYEPVRIIIPCTLSATCQTASIFLILKAFAAGCTALTGIETISNAVPNFAEPAIKNAKKTIVLLAIVILCLFGGVVWLARLYPVLPSENIPVLAQINAQIFGHTFMYYFIQLATLIILIMAANGAYAGFPMLLSIMGRDGFVPRQFSKRGERLNYANGITFLTVVAGILILLFDANVSNLIGLYAIGVFTSFTLSQFGMCIHWIRSPNAPHARRKAIICAIGAIATCITVIMITQAKFMRGAWIVLVAIPIAVAIMLKIKRHYSAVYGQIKMSYEEIKDAEETFKQPIRNHVIVPLVGINKATIIALRYAQSISPTVIAFHVVMEEESAKKINEQWRLLKTDIPLIVKYSPYRKVVDPLTEFVKNYQQEECKPGDMITIILTQFSVISWWHIFLHNQTSIWITRGLLKQKQVAITTIPFQLLRDSQVVID